jgi:RNA polymerase sigma factor (sigma-70 family)
MPTMPMSEVIQQLRSTLLLPRAAELTDAQLLESFVSRRETLALEALVRRHGLMVWNVCRRLLRNHHDAEDAFQATFLVLLRKAASIRSRAQVGNWLYGVAHQTALKARAVRARRTLREKSVTEMPEPAVREPDLWSDLQPLLDQEVSRLPQKQRMVLVLCALEGKTLKEAARELGCPEGTVASRLARARALLAKRLTRQGVALSSGTLTCVLSQKAASAAVPKSVLASTITAVTRLAAGQAATGVVAARVAALLEGVMKAMLMTRLKTALGICLGVGLLLGSLFGYRAILGGQAAAGPPKDRLADTLILLDKQWWEAASRYDVDTLSKLLADDWVGFDRGIAPSPDSPAWTKAASLENYRRFRFTDVKLVKDREVFRIDGHTALMIYEVKWRAEGKDGKASSGQSRYVRCWVQRDGGWFVKHTECVNLPAATEEPTPFVVPLLTEPKGKAEPPWKLGVRASGSWATEVPENAFDGKHDTDWNAGDYAPAWIERDLGASLPLASIALFPCQDIPGPTTHEVWVSNEPIGNDRTKARLVHTFKGETTNLQALKFDFSRDLSARYIEVRTTQSPTWIAWWEIEIRVWKQGKVAPPSQAAQTRPGADIAALQGIWQVVAVERGGKGVTGERKEEWDVKGDLIAVRAKHLSTMTSAVFSVDPTKNPKEININPYPIGASLGDADIAKGIYTLDGDVWKVCLPRMPLHPGREARPKEMVTKEGSDAVLITLKRVKPR